MIFVKTKDLPIRIEILLCWSFCNNHLGIPEKKQKLIFRIIEANNDGIINKLKEHLESYDESHSSFCWKNTR